MDEPLDILLGVLFVIFTVVSILILVAGVILGLSWAVYLITQLFPPL